MSNEFNVGDLVEGTKGVCVVRGVVEFSAINNRYVSFDGFHLSLDWFRINRWRLDLITAAPVPLPTVPGIYTDCEGDVWRVEGNGDLSPLVDYAASHEKLERITKMAADYAPFTLLAPVSA